MKIKIAEIIKYKKCTPKQKELLNLFNDLLDTILTDKTLISSKNKTEKKKENVNEHEKTLMSSKDDDDENENEDDDETIRDLIDNLEEIFDKSKSFEEQIKSLKKEKI